MNRVAALLLAIGVVLGVACLPLAFGLPRGHDWLYELVRIAQFREALWAGQFPPAWAGDLYGGYGSPFFLFYPPLFYLGSALFYPITGSTPATMVVTLVAVTGVSALAIYLTGREASLARPLDRGMAARITLYLYVLNPYLLCDKLLRNSNAEFSGLSLLPLVPLGILIISRDASKGVLVASMGLALVTATHNITALSAAAIALGLALVLYLPRPSKTTVASVVAAIVLGLLLSAFFWIPAFGLLSLVRGNELLSGKFDFHNQFIHPGSVFSYESFYSIGILPLAVLAGIVAATWATRREPSRDRRLLFASLALAGFLVYLMTEASVLVWEHFPLLAFFEFPWRLLGPFAMVVALAGGLAFSRLTSTWGATAKGLFEIGVLAACIVNAVPGLQRVQTIPSEEWPRLEELVEPASIRQRGLKATVYSEFMPKPSVRDAWRDERPMKGPLTAIPPAATVRVIRSDSIDMQLEVDATSPTDLHFARWFFPGWRATVDGEPVALERSVTGAIAIPVPAGSHLVRCYFDDPPIRRAGNWISLFAAGAWLALLVARRRGPPRAPNDAGTIDSGGRSLKGDPESERAGPP